MAPIFPAVDQWNIREIIPRRIDPWGCFVGQLVPLHEIIPPVGAMGEKPTIWEPSIYEGHERLHGLSEVLFCAFFLSRLSKTSVLYFIVMKIDASIRT